MLNVFIVVIENVSTVVNKKIFVKFLKEKKLFYTEVIK